MGKEIPEMLHLTTKIIKEHGLTQEEYAKICEILSREPNYTELGIFSAMWNEHCSYKSSKAILKDLPTQAPWVIEGPGENAGIIDIGNGLAIVMKIESHNHPSAVEPYQGATTGVGGIIRDIFTMGARPIALLNSLRFGPLNNERVRYLLSNVVAGIAGYGNCMGIPTVGGEVYFEEPYEGNPLVNAMCVGLVKTDRIVKGIARGEGNLIIYVGSATGRDGIHGASFASRELTEESYEDRPSVQVGDPFMEKLLLEACLELLETDYVIGMQDMGAAGLTSSSSEMAYRGKSGIEIDLSLVPRREQGMTPYELMLSESQERMLICVKKGTESEVEKIFKKWDLHGRVIGMVTNDGILRVKDAGQIVAEIPINGLTNSAPVYYRPEKKPDYLQELQAINPCILSHTVDYNEILLNLLISSNIGSKKWVYEQYDHMVRTSTVILPGAGDAAVLIIKDNSQSSTKAIALTTDGNGRYCYLDPFVGGMISVSEAARNLVCVGAKPLAVTNCLNFGNPEKHEVMWQFKQVVAGMSKACSYLETPVTGGNVSFYNETEVVSIYPTPVVGMLGVIQNTRYRIQDAGFKNKGDLIILLGETKDELGGSEYLKVIHKIVAGNPPLMDLILEKQVQSACLELIDTGIINSAHDCSEGGIAVSLSESCIIGQIGATINLDSLSLSPYATLFSETQSRIIVSISEKNLKQLNKITNIYQIPFSVIGMVGGNELVINQWIKLPVSLIKKKWEKALRID